MNLPFQPAASPAPKPAFTKQLITMDWEGTLSLEKGPNKDLYIFAAVALQKGHDVVIATTMRDLEFLKMMMTDLHSRQMKNEFKNLGLPFPLLPVYSKETLQKEMRILGHETAILAVDNNPDTIKEYIRAGFSGSVDTQGNVEDIEELAALVGIKKEFQEARQIAGMIKPPGFDCGQR